MYARRDATRLLAIAALAAGLVACEDPGEEVAGDDFTEAVPSSAQLALTVDDGDPAGADAPADTPSEVRARTQEVLERVDAVIAETQDRLHAIAAEVEPETKTIGGFDCKRWTQAGEAVEWRLTACTQDSRARRRGFELEGRRIDAAGDAEFLVVAAGHGTRLPRFDGKKRGHGRVGYDFDNLRALTGRGPTGKVGVGFRAVGKLRRLNVGLRDFQREGMDPANALYTYRHVVGEGGQVKLRTRADLVMLDEDGDLVRGEDELLELGRVVVAWRAGAGARAAVTLCGGTVGEGECVHVERCWARDPRVPSQDPADAPRYEPAECPAPALDAEDAPADGELDVPGEDGELPGPAVEEPAE